MNVYKEDSWYLLPLCRLTLYTNLQGIGFLLQQAKYLKSLSCLHDGLSIKLLSRKIWTISYCILQLQREKKYRVIEKEKKGKNKQKHQSFF
jgi:hypothetical protein